LFAFFAQFGEVIDVVIKHAYTTGNAAFTAGGEAELLCRTISGDDNSSLFLDHVKSAVSLFLTSLVLANANISTPSYKAKQSSAEVSDASVQEMQHRNHF
jgi:hypothetical protein